MRLIDADALMESLYDELGEGEVLYRIPPDAVDSAPTVDAVEVVRCKDCKQFKEWKNKWGVEGFKCDLICSDVAPDNFCCWGERRDKDAVD